MFQSKSSTSSSLTPTSFVPFKLSYILAMGLLGGPIHGQTLEIPRVKSDPAIAAAQNSFSGHIHVVKLHLQGNSEWQTGGTSDSGPVTIDADDKGFGRVTFHLNSGDRIEEVGTSNHGRTCTHTAEGHTSQRLTAECWLPLSWFAPSLALQTTEANAERQTTSLGLQKREGTSVYTVQHHLDVSAHVRPPKQGAPDTAAMIRSLSESELDLDPQTSLPTSLHYNLPSTFTRYSQSKVVVRYSDYRTVDGITIPFVIDRYVNGALQVRITVSTVSFE